MGRTTATILMVSASFAGMSRPLPAHPAQASATLPPKVDACSLLTKAQVKEHLPWEPMFDQMPLERDDIGQTGSACSYPTVTVQVLSYTPRFMETARKIRPQEAVTGVGEEAFVSHNPAGYVELMSKVGPRTLTLQAHIDRGSTYESTKPKTIALAKALVAQLK